MDLSFKVNLSTKPVVDFFSGNSETFKNHLISGAKVVSSGADKLSKFMFGSTASSACTFSAFAALGTAIYAPNKTVTWAGASVLSSVIQMIKRNELDLEEIEEEAFSKLMENHEDINDMEELLTSYSNEFEVLKHDLVAAKESEASPLYDVAQVNLLAMAIIPFFNGSSF